MRNGNDRCPIAYYASPPFQDISHFQLYCQPGDLVRVYRETEKRHGPYTVLNVENKQVFIDRNGTMVQHNYAHLIPENVYSGRNQLSVIRDALKSAHPPYNSSAILTNCLTDASAAVSRARIPKRDFSHP